jgi:hypothetical protein
METGTAAVTDKGDITDLRQESMTALQGLLPDAVQALRRNLSCGKPEAEIAAAKVILNQLVAPQTAYSFVGHVSNQTNYTLMLKRKGTNGSWKEQPPETIPPGGSARFGATYDGFDFTGDVIYEAGSGEFKMEWKIPLFGNNSIHSSTTIPGTSASHQGGRGWHAEVWYYLKLA